MAFYLSPIGNNTQTSTSGAPLNAGTITTYQAGTTTPQTTYTDNTGGTPQANPITLNTYGLPSSPIWLTGGQTYKFLIKDSLGNTVRTVDNVSGINDQTGASSLDQWLLFTGALTFISATSFSVVGDQTATLQIRRRLKTTNTGGTIYSTITNSVFAAGITTVAVTNDAGVIDSGLSALRYGVLSSQNTSTPAGAVINRAYAEYTANTDIATIIPFDDTIPQSTEGTQIISVSYTPQSATNRLRIRFQGDVSTATGALNVAAAVFSSASVNALRATPVTVPTANYLLPIVCEIEYVPGVTTAITFSVRVGAQSATAFRLNGTGAARLFGGVMASTLVIEEIAA